MCFFQNLASFFAAFVLIIISPLLLIPYLKRKFTRITFENKVAWITGASSGIGEALTYQLNSLGCFVYISARRREELERVKKNSPNPGLIEVVPLDLAKSQNVFEIASELISKQTTKIDILIHNGGLSMRAAALETKLEEDEYIMNVNFLSTVFLTKAVLPGMMKRKEGQIVVVSSIQGKVGIPYRTTYAASKHALIGYFDSLRAELLYDNIAVTTICPGYVRTNLGKNAVVPSGSAKDEAQRGMEPRRIAELMSRHIFFKDKEVLLDNEILPKIAVALRNLTPNLIFKMISKRTQKPGVK